VGGQVKKLQKKYFQILRGDKKRMNDEKGIGFQKR
jgi:hypothetical protein